MEYAYLIKYSFFALFLASLLFVVSFFFVYQQPNLEKFSAYECGFNPFGDARSKFEIRFCLVGILFIIFDLELTYLFPWILSIQYISFLGVYAMFVFIFILTLGFVYEWLKGGLEWD